MKDPVIRVLLIEDDPMVLEINRQFVEQVEGFEVAGVASNGSEGMKMIHKEKPDLALVDIYMPNKNGLETIAQIRAEGYSTDVIAITAASDIETVRRIRQLGAIDYIMKPFKADRIKKALANYRDYYLKLQDKETISQQELDAIIFQGSIEEKKQLPKGLNAHTLEKVAAFLKEQKEAISAEQVAEGIGIARVTARRYLEYMEQTGSVKIHIEYGGIGRPINRYVIV